MLDPGKELVMESPERLRSIGCEELLQMILYDQGRGVADLRHGQACAASRTCHDMITFLF